MGCLREPEGCCSPASGGSAGLAMPGSFEAPPSQALVVVVPKPVIVTAAVLQGILPAAVS